MTPEERELVSGLFDRLAALENSPRDPDAERAIIEGLRRAPNATYALVQTALVQDEALKRANARIQELEGAPPEGAPARPGFLRLFADPKQDVLVGAVSVGPQAAEWLGQLTLAIRAAVPLETLLDTIQPYPTFSEGVFLALQELDAALS